MTRVVVTSDFHGHLPPDVPPCDLLIVAGDVLGSVGRTVDELRVWLGRQPATEIVGVAGNHDFVAHDSRGIPRGLPWVYLHNETVEVCGLKVFGSPMSMLFGGWPFMATDDALAKVWAKIPDDVDVLVVHGPAHGILDRTSQGAVTGSRSLRARLPLLPSLQLLATGHIHEEYGTTHVPLDVHGVEGMRWLRCVNGSHMDERYRPVNPPVEVTLQPKEER